MSIARPPDPFPGRCLNYRHHDHAIDGRSETLRCLESEGTEHVCRFPEPIVHKRSDWGPYQMSSLGKPPPAPWVVPAR